MARVLIVVDMLRGFCEEGYPLYCGPESREIIPFIQSKIDEANQRGDLVVFVADNHDPDDKEFQMFPRHCVVGTPEAEVIPELAGRAKNSCVLPKKRYSGFFGTDLDKRLAALQPEVVEVVGVCTNICVYFTVEELRNRDYPVVVYEDGVASFDLRAHKFALEQMENVLGATVK